MDAIETNSTLSFGILKLRPFTSFHVSELKRILSRRARAKALSTCFAMVGTLIFSVMKMRWMGEPFDVDRTVSSSLSALLVKCSMSSSPPDMIIAKCMKCSPRSLMSQGSTRSLLTQSLTRLAQEKGRKMKQTGRKDMAKEGRDMLTEKLSQMETVRRRRHDIR